MQQSLGFHGELALDRHAQLLRDAGVDRPGTTHLAANAAGVRADAKASRRQAGPLRATAGLMPSGAAARLVFALSSLRRTAQVRPRLSGA
jgi:hypothetical protein